MKRLLLASLLMCGLAHAGSQYDEASRYADSVKGKGMSALSGTSAADIPGYQGSSDATGYYHGGTAVSSGDLESAGTQSMNGSTTGKLIQDVIKNRPPDIISTDAPFMKNGLDVVADADTLMQGTDTQCKSVDVSKSQLTYYTCERTPSVQLACTRTASAGGGHEEDTTERKTVTIRSSSIAFANLNGAFAGTVLPPLSGRVISASATYSWAKKLAYSNANYFARISTPFGQIAMNDSEGSVALSGGMVLSGSEPLTFSIRSRNDRPFLATIWGNSNMRYVFTITLIIEVPAKRWVPDVVWSESCPFNKAEQVLLGTTCTQAGGDRTVTVNGEPYTLHSDCWQYTDTYVSQSADTGTCGQYMTNSACTVSRTTCLESLAGNCLRERAVFSCQSQSAGKAQVCGTQLVCTDGSCDQITNDGVDSFKKAVSQLATLAAAGKDISELNGINVRAFTGQGTSCRKATAGFSNCCKDGGWGTDAGLAQCNTEEKAIGVAKSRKLTIYVGSYCSKKALGICLQKKEGYCQFDSKLARIVQEQGRMGQLGIGFGSGKSPDCRGLTPEELQRLNFGLINFADFYDDLENGTVMPTDQTLLDRIKSQVTDKMQER